MLLEVGRDVVRKEDYADREGAQLDLFLKTFFFMFPPITLRDLLLILSKEAEPRKAVMADKKWPCKGIVLHVNLPKQI